MSPLTRRPSPCFICLNPTYSGDDGVPDSTSPSCSSPGNKRNEKISQKFAILASSYLNLKCDSAKPVGSQKRKETKRSSSTTTAMQICEDCVPVAKSVCETYELWCSVQKDLNQRLKEVAKVIRNTTIAASTNGEGAKSEIEVDTSHLFPSPSAARKSLLTATAQLEKFRNIFLKEVEKKWKERSAQPKATPIKKARTKTTTATNQNETEVEIEEFTTPLMKLEGGTDENELADDNGDDMFASLWDDHVDDDLPVPGTGAEPLQEAVPVDPLKTSADDLLNITPSLFSQEEEPITTKKPRPHIPQKISQVFPCIFCPCMSRGRNRLEIHMRQHTLETPYSCRFCDKCFISRGTHVRHENRHSEDGIEKSFLCSVCPKQFKTMLSLRRHLQTHNPEGVAKCDPELSFLCKSCGKSCTSRPQLWRHEKIHSDDRPYKCPHCEKSFQQSACRDRHAVVHTGEKPYKCSSCDKTFADPSNRRVHERQMHNKVFRLDEKKYNCKYCGKRFSCQTQLDRHERVHSGERPFGCGLCEKAFKRKSHLEAHEKLHTGATGESRRVCKICGKVFQSFPMRIRHEQRVHGYPTPLPEVPSIPTDDSSEVGSILSCDVEIKHDLQNVDIYRPFLAAGMR